MPPPPPVDLRNVARELADLDARFIEYASQVPHLVLDLFGERSRCLEVLPGRRPGRVRVPDVVVLAGVFGVPDDEPRVLHVEWQSRVDPRMGDRMLQYGLDLSLRYSLPVRSIVVLAVGDRPSDRPSARLVATSNGTEPMTLVSYDTIALRATWWSDLVDPARPSLAALVPTARDGATRPALRASLRVLSEHFGADPTAFSLGLALHLRLAELHSCSLTGWKMAAQAEDIEISDGLDWTRDGVVRDIVLLHQKLYDDGRQAGMEEGLQQGLQKGLEQGHQKGVEQGLQQGVLRGRHEGADLGRREALLDVAAAVASEEQLAELRSIDDVRELADAVKALLPR